MQFASRRVPSLYCQAARGDHGILYLPMLLAFHSNLSDIHEGTVRPGWKTFGWCASLIQTSPNNIHRCMHSIGMESRALWTLASICSSFFVGGYNLYSLFAYLQWQHCSMKLSSQWNFRRIICLNTRAWQCSSRRLATLMKSGSLKRVLRQ
jgi:hypothetical protein